MQRVSSFAFEVYARALTHTRDSWLPCLAQYSVQISGDVCQVRPAKQRRRQGRFDRQQSREVFRSDSSAEETELGTRDLSEIKADRVPRTSSIDLVDATSSTALTRSSSCRHASR